MSEEFEIGDRVRLISTDDLDEETGVIEGTDGPGMWVVRVDYTTGPDDDGLRGGLTEDQMEYIGDD